MDLRFAYHLACLADLAYKSPETVYPTAEQLGYYFCEFFDCKGTQAYAMMGQDRTIVAFRGTEPNRLEDWITDFRRWKQPVARSQDFGLIHAGFDSAFNDVWSTGLGTFVTSSRCPVFLTGHSLGGALATRAVIEALLNGWSVAGLYTYGQPRVGNRKFARQFNQQFKNAYRFVHNNDVVSRVPWVGYWHIGQLVYLTAVGEIVPNPSQWQIVRDRINGRWRRWIADGIRDHNMSDYKTILAANLGTYQ